MNRKKIKIQLEDADGGKYDLALEGNISKTKIIKFIEVLDLLEVKGKDNFEENTKLREKDNLTSIGSKIWNLVEQQFPYSTFTSSDILEIYEDEYQEPIQLSVVATYLSRYSEKNKLSRNKRGKEWLYKVIRKQSIVKEQREGTYEQPHQISHEFPDVN
jgi:predicted transcriptional regulator